jgi:hypothetical protein
VFTIVLIHVVVGVAVIAMATAAPVKTRDRLLLRHVTLPKAEVSLGELKALADDELRSLHFPVRVRISFEPVNSGRVVRSSGREMTLRDFLAAIEGQPRWFSNEACQSIMEGRAMRLPRTTIRRLMVAVAVIAFDCGCLIEGTFSGLLVPVLGLNVGLLRLTRTRDRARQFWTWFVVTNLLAVGGYVALAYVALEAAARWPTAVVNGVIWHLPGAAAVALEQSLSAFLANSSLGSLALLGTTIGVPLVLLAVAGGWVAVALGTVRATRLACVEPKPAGGGTAEP